MHGTPMHGTLTHITPMHPLIIFASWLGALLLLLIVATGVLGSVAYDRLKGSVGAFLGLTP
jgi:hypothetical protein